MSSFHMIFVLFSKLLCSFTMSTGYFTNQQKIDMKISIHKSVYILLFLGFKM